MASLAKQWAAVGAFISAVFVTGGTFVALESWTTMHQIQTQGVLGQAIYQEQYEEAVRNLKLFGTVVMVGFLLGIVSTGAYISGTLEELS
jgi:hypothetical protein